MASYSFNKVAAVANDLEPEYYQKLLYQDVVWVSWQVRSDTTNEQIERKLKAKMADREEEK